jgi:VanZ family protein
MTFKEQNPSREDSGLRIDYLEHFFLYAIIPILYFLSRGAGLKKLFKDNYYLILLGILFALLTEIQQYFIPGRSFNPVDLFLNLAGFITGIFAGQYLNKKFLLSNEK